MQFIESRVRFSSTTCHYCDCIDIFIGKTTNDVRNYHLDHYLDRAKCPILALSLNNLIPVCPFCNMKKATNKFGVNPLQTKLLSPFNPSYDFENQVQIKVHMGGVDDTAKIKTSESYKNIDIRFDFKAGADIYTKETDVTKIEERFYNNKQSNAYAEMAGMYEYLYSPRSRFSRWIDRIAARDKKNAYVPLPNEAERRGGKRVKYDKFRRDMEKQNKGK